MSDRGCLLVTRVTLSGLMCCRSQKILRSVETSKDIDISQIYVLTTIRLSARFSYNGSRARWLVHPHIEERACDADTVQHDQARIESGGLSTPRHRRNLDLACRFRVSQRTAGHFHVQSLPLRETYSTRPGRICGLKHVSRSCHRRY